MVRGSTDPARLVAGGLGITRLTGQIATGQKIRLETPRTNGTEFHMAEVCHGLILPLIWRSMPDMQPGFELFADGLKRIAEGTR